ncbi:hypothetical protein QWY77_05185 [Thalassotalea ponticola]|uniref:hypothetical protein n=1 Tax=Thalassotalea ponticola TaxID=1523392 RepID=UPI0025B5E889|nr:hypothetical protein [Thalassotalea ponticola]MDN3652156.1 hypothetical protein [Thalassotalea ponticola]
MYVESFINEKISQLVYYLKALLKNSIHYTEVDTFIWDCFEEWGQLNVTDDTPYCAKERVFWHLIHEIKLASLGNVQSDMALRNEIQVCVNFLTDQGRYPVHCVGWRPVAEF